MDDLYDIVIINKPNEGSPEINCVNSIESKLENIVDFNLNDNNNNNNKNDNNNENNNNNDKDIKY